jgi:hypothetical protein
MKRKITILSLAVCLGLSFQSCEKWFDVTANNQIKAEDQFSSADGFRDALMGVYLSMGDQSLYAKDMTFNLVDVLSQTYSTFTSAGAAYAGIQSFNYTSVRSEAQIQQLWDKLYYSIANVNSSLAYLNKSEFAWNAGEKEIIKGELLALRAFLHFDLIRLFGHNNYSNRAELKSKLTIPYVTSYTKELTAQLNYEETFALLESDITEALTLLQYDPIYKNSKLSANALLELNRDGFYSNRNFRMNYYAAKGLQARVLAWQGGAKAQQAALAAEEVIANSEAVLLKENQSVSNNKTIIQEHLFGLKIEGMQNISNPLLDGASNTNYQALRVNSAVAEQIFETSNPEIGAVDIRLLHLLPSEQLGRISTKLRQVDINHLDYNVVPLMKLPEMYYIAAEYYSTTNNTKAISLLETVRKSRRIVNNLATDLTTAQITAEIQKEYRKEFISEGQLFFYYKRKGLEQIPNYTSASGLDDKVYMLPYPASEVEFGNRVQ